MSVLKAKNLNSASDSGAFVLPEFMHSVRRNETIEIPIGKLVEAKIEWNFYKPLGKGKMEELTKSIEQNGLIHPIVVWRKSPDNHIVLSGHNRVRAYKLLFEATNNNKYLAILAQIRYGISEVEARELIIDSNWVQRTLSPSERTKSIYHKYVLLGRKKRSNGTTEQQRTYDIVAKDYNLSGKQIQRYIKLNQLIPELLELLDDNKITLRSGVKIAGFEPILQKYIFSLIQNVPDNKKIDHLRKDMDEEDIYNLLCTDAKHDISITVIIPEYLKNRFLDHIDQWIQLEKEL